MRFIADFHLHSHFSRATSKEMNPLSLWKWGQIKGLNVLGTGDFTQPKYFEELKEKLEPANETNGLFQLKKEFTKEIEKEIPSLCRTEMYFMLSVEISCIYKRNGKVRKMHCLVIAPNFETVSKINLQLQKIGNLVSDGRPILGLDAEKLLMIVKEASPDCLFIPAHVWTPHFSVFGANSGFDSLEEAFGENAKYIDAMETGLSSDPMMNWRISRHHNIAFVSNSDAHSAEKIGREANIFSTGLTYPAIVKALRENDIKAFESTIEFFPQEGKYHADGHLTCEVCMTPSETIEQNFLCPKCQKKVTVGVLHRVHALADLPEGAKPEKFRPFRYIIPLPEIIAEVLDQGVSTKAVKKTYQEMIGSLGNEFHILLDAKISEIEKKSSILFARAIERVRQGKVSLNPGYDGKFGTIKIFEPDERKNFTRQQLTIFE